LFLTVHAEPPKVDTGLLSVKSPAYEMSRPSGAGRCASSETGKEQVMDWVRIFHKDRGKLLPTKNQIVQALSAVNARLQGEPEYRETDESVKVSYTYQGEHFRTSDFEKALGQAVGGSASSYEFEWSDK
jgi:hypothetical protein